MYCLSLLLNKLTTTLDKGYMDLRSSRQLKITMNLVFANGNDVRIYLHIERWRSEIDHKWSLKTHVETHINARCEQAYLELSSCDWIIQDAC